MGVWRPCTTGLQPQPLTAQTDAQLVVGECTTRPQCVQEGTLQPRCESVTVCCGCAALAVTTVEQQRRVAALRPSGKGLLGPKCGACSALCEAGWLPQACTHALCRGGVAVCTSGAWLLAMLMPACSQAGVHGHSKVDALAVAGGGDARGKGPGCLATRVGTGGRPACNKYTGHTCDRHAVTSSCPRTGLRQTGARAAACPPQQQHTQQRHCRPCVHPLVCLRWRCRQRLQLSGQQLPSARPAAAGRLLRPLLAAHLSRVHVCATAARAKRSAQASHSACACRAVRVRAALCVCTCVRVRVWLVLRVAPDMLRRSTAAALLRRRRTAAAAAAALMPPAAAGAAAAAAAAAVEPGAGAPCGACLPPCCGSGCCCLSCCAGTASPAAAKNLPSAEAATAIRVPGKASGMPTSTGTGSWPAHTRHAPHTRTHNAQRRRAGSVVGRREVTRHTMQLDVLSPTPHLFAARLP
jgi:hypothetical protein